MSIEAYFQHQKEKEQEKEQEKAKDDEKKLKETKMLVLLHIKEELEKLKFLVLHGLEKKENINLSQIAQTDEIAKILEKIQQIEDLKDIDSILPKEYRITKQDYLLALKDESEKQKVITKIEKAVNFIQSKYSLLSKDFLLNMFVFLNIFLSYQIRLIKNNLQEIKNSLLKK